MKGLLGQARALARRIRKESGRRPLQIFIRMKIGPLVRFTNNGIHQNGFQDLVSFTLMQPAGKATVWSESNDLTLEGIRKALAFFNRHPERSSAQDRLREGSKFFAEPPCVKEWFGLDLKKTPEAATKVIENAVKLIRGRQATVNGYYSAYQRFFYFENAQGLERSHPATAVRFGVTVTKGEGKGYRSFYHPNPALLKEQEVAQEAIHLAEWAAEGEVTVKPGVYECIFSPRALLELMEPLRRHFDAQLTKDKKSIFSGLLGKKIFSPAFTLSDDVTCRGQFGLPFDAQGAPKKKVVLIRRGVLNELLAKGHSTRGLAEHPFNPENLVVEPGKFSFDGLFKQIRRGIFINKIWYHTLVREPRMEVTGLATAGALYIENGRVRGRAPHLRYHDSLFSILGSVAGATKERLLLKDGERGAALFPYVWVSRLRIV